MGYWLAGLTNAAHKSWLKRFDATYWTVDFPRPMMAAVTSTGARSLRVDAVFYRKNDLAGLIWASVDSIDHPLTAYETARDYRGCTLKFHWKSSGIIALDAINGPVLTIEGRDAGGLARSWYVRLWNYANGTNQDADIAIDFSTVAGGFTVPGEAVWAGDIDRMFISLVPVGYDNSNAALPVAIEAWAELSAIACDGAGSVLSVGDVLVPPHGLGIATGYDDSYNVTPARMLHNAHRLGYRGAINHYVGMSHYYRLEPSGGGYYASLTGGAINVATAAWHRDFALRAKALGYGLILSLSYELFDANCWNDWKQRASNGDPAATGYTPPSTLLSPAHGGAMAYLAAVARAFVLIAVTAGQVPKFQIGEPWWWVMPDGRICLYDVAAKAALGGNPAVIDNIRGSLSAAQKAVLDSAGALLAASTAGIFAAVRGDQPTCQRLLLAYLPVLLDATAPEVRRANMPVGWAAPAFDVLQLEDYDWVTSGDAGASARGVADATMRLGYPPSAQHYLSGFVVSDRAQWAPVNAAAEAARGVAARYIWALPQVMRDGFVHFDLEDGGVNAFDDVDFPLALGRGARVEPGFSTAVVTTASGHEQRNADWASARLRYDAGPGVRSEADVTALIAFFRARRGAAKAFRFRDPTDFSSNGMTGTPVAADQLLGTGDGVRTSFALVKRYGVGVDAEVRMISRPVALSLQVAMGGAVVSTGWSLLAGTLVFTTAPAAGLEVRAGFLFDVPVRFAEDSLKVSLVTFLAGDVPDVPLIEVREG